MMKGSSLRELVGIPSACHFRFQDATAELQQVRGDRGRPEVVYFSPDEMLFRRYRVQDWSSGVLSPLGFKFPRQSLNRETLCELEDVLFSDLGEFNGWGVLAFRTDDLPSSLNLPNVEAISFA